MIFGNVQFTTQAVQLLLRQGVELVLFSRSGRLFGQVYEQFITQPTACAEDQSETTFRQLFRRQAERLKRAVVDDVPYSPFIFQW